MSNDQVKFAAKNIKAKCIACELWVKRVNTFGVVMTRIFHFAFLLNCILGSDQQQNTAQAGACMVA